MAGKNKRFVIKPHLGVLISFAVGSLFGLIVLGWALWPVEWFDTETAQMRPDILQDYVRMVTYHSR